MTKSKRGAISRTKIALARKIAIAQRDDTGNVSPEQVAEATGYSVKFVELALREPLPNRIPDTDDDPVNCRNVPAVYLARCARIKRLLKRFPELLDSHGIDQEADPTLRAWGNDLNDVERALRNAVIVLGGHA